VLQVHDVDLARIDPLGLGVLQLVDVPPECRPFETLPAHGQQADPCRRRLPGWGREHEGLSADQRFGTGVQVEEQFDAATRAARRQIETRRDVRRSQRRCHRIVPISS
jgi:hypothetical protein